jgi:hypothetical protein
VCAVSYLILVIFSLLIFVLVWKFVYNILFLWDFLAVTFTFRNSSLPCLLDLFAFLSRPRCMWLLTGILTRRIQYAYSNIAFFSTNYKEEKNTHRGCARHGKPCNSMSSVMAAITHRVADLFSLTSISTSIILLPDFMHGVTGVKSRPLIRVICAACKFATYASVNLTQSSTLIASSTTYSWLSLGLPSRIQFLRFVQFVVIDSRCMHTNNSLARTL